MSKCNGDGWCFKQIDNDTFVKKPGYKCKCRLITCPNCKSEKFPKSLGDCLGGYCQNCAIKLSIS